MNLITDHKALLSVNLRSFAAPQRESDQVNQSSKKYAANGHARSITRHVEASNSAFISPIERWPDTNYAPQELEYVVNHYSNVTEVIAPLHGFDPDDVQIDISRGHLLILMSYIGRTVYPSRQEFYCEVPLPMDVKEHEAVAEFSSGFITVRLDKKPVPVKQAASLGRAFKNGLTLLCKGWTLGRFDY